MKLYNSDTAERLTAKQIGITDAEYQELVRESEATPGEGHVCASNGMRVYAA